MERHQYRAGLIGCGFIANQKHLPALEKQKDRIAIAAVCDLRAERAQKAAKQYGIPDCKVYENYREMIQDKTLDVIYVLTPNRSHSELTIAALDAGKHVLCEKPMATGAREAGLMVDAAKRNKKLLTIGYQNRCSPESQTLKRIAETGDLGDVYYAQAHAIRRRGIPNWGVFLNKEEQGGGALIDIGTHALDLTLWFTNNYEPKTVFGRTYNKLGSADTAGNSFGPWDPKAFGQVEDSAFATIVMKNGAWITLEVSWALNTLDTREQKVTLCGTKGGADMDTVLRINGVKYGELYTLQPALPPPSGNPPFTGGKSPADVELEHWLNALDGKSEVLVKPEQALVVTQILEAVYESARTGKTVELG
jgi:predicted dehydrogenase